MDKKKKTALVRAQAKPTLARRPEVVKETPAERALGQGVKALRAALARLPVPAPVVPVAVEPAAATMLTDEIAIGNLGLVELKLTPEEEAVLSEVPRPEDVQLKPTGQVYLSHPAYTRWFNRAFGRTGWTLVPVAKPMKAETCVVVPYVLHVHGKPVAFAVGEQEYHPSNREQTYGDVVESTVASALRRCAKRLGVGLELWDRDWGGRFLRTHGVRVPVVVDRDGGRKTIYQWRRRDSLPFWNEITQQHEEPERPTERPTERPPAASAPKAGSSKSDEPISEPQRVRFWTVARKAGRRESEIKLWLAREGIESTTEIKRRDYDRLVAIIEAPGPLPGTREPGDEA